MPRLRDAAWVRLRRLAGCRKGAAILEFALVLPILLVVAGGVFEIGRALSVRAALAGAARAGARYLARAPDPECRPACSPGALHAIGIAQQQAIENTGLGGERIDVAIAREPPSGTVVIVATAELPAALFAVPGWRPSWPLRASHQEARVAD